MKVTSRHTAQLGLRADTWSTLSEWLGALVAAKNAGAPPDARIVLRVPTFTDAQDGPAVMWETESEEDAS